MPLNITPASLLSDASLASDLLLTSSRVDVVQILDQNTLQQVFARARPLKCEVREYAKVMDYPVETGVTLSDHRISMPTEIIFTCIITFQDYSSTFPAIRNAWTNATLLSVQTRVGTYKNIIIAELPHDEDAEVFNAITITLKMREVIMTVPSSSAQTSNLSNFTPTQPQYQTSIDSGIIAATPLIGSGLSYFNSLSVVGRTFF